MRKISDAAKASTTMPRKVLNPSSEKKKTLKEFMTYAILVNLEFFQIMLT